MVLLLIAAVALNQGMDSVLASSGSPKNVILVGKGSEESIERSEDLAYHSVSQRTNHGMHAARAMMCQAIARAARAATA